MLMMMMMIVESKWWSSSWWLFRRKPDHTHQKKSISKLFLPKERHWEREDNRFLTPTQFFVCCNRPMVNRLFEKKNFFIKLIIKIVSKLYLWVCVFSSSSMIINNQWTIVKHWLTVNDIFVLTKRKKNFYNKCCKRTHTIFWCWLKFNRNNNLAVSFCSVVVIKLNSQITCLDFFFRFSFFSILFITCTLGYPHYIQCGNVILLYKSNDNSNQERERLTH